MAQNKKSMVGRVFALALLLSLLIHLIFIFADLLPTLQIKPKPALKIIDVELSALVLNSDSTKLSQKISNPERPLKTNTNTKAKNPSLGKGLHPVVKFDQAVPGLRFSGSMPLHPEPAQKPTKFDNQVASSPVAENKSALEPIRHQSASAALAESIFGEPESIFAKNTKIVTANTRDRGAGHKLLGARDAQNMVIATQVLQGLPREAKLIYLEENFGVPCRMYWQRSAGEYKLTLEVKIPFNKMKYQTHGLIGPTHGLQPLQFEEFRNEKLRRNTVFDWHEHLLHFDDNGKIDSAKLEDGAQDLLSLSWQLALKGAHLEGNTQITNGRKVYSYPVRPGNGVIFDGVNGSMRAKIIKTQYGKEQVELWLAPDFANIPIRIIFKKPGEPNLDLQITSIELNGLKEWERPDKRMEPIQR